MESFGIAIMAIVDDPGGGRSVNPMATTQQTDQLSRIAYLMYDRWFGREFK